MSLLVLKLSADNLLSAVGDDRLLDYLHSVSKFVWIRKDNLLCVSFQRECSGGGGRSSI